MILSHKENLGFLPTPFQKLNQLSKLYPDYNIYIKRDDQTGLATGGNKTRKLEYLIYEALKSGSNTVITAGAQQSNHCRQTVAACASKDLECHLLLGGTEPAVYDGNLLLSHLLGAKIHFTGENRKGEDIEQIKIELENQGKKVYVVPYGGSNITGVLGYVNAVKEIKNQLDEAQIKMDYVFFASSSGGTQAGLALGKMKFDIEFKLMPISIDKESINGHTIQELVFDLVNEGKEKLNLKNAFNFEDGKLITGYDKLGYGVVSENEKDAIKELAANEGVLLDPVYSGRAFYGMVDFLRQHKLPKNANVLFWHTGGLPSIFYYKDKIK